MHMNDYGMLSHNIICTLNHKCNFIRSHIHVHAFLLLYVATCISWWRQLGLDGSQLREKVDGRSGGMDIPNKQLGERGDSGTSQRVEEVRELHYNTYSLYSTSELV